MFDPDTPKSSESTENAEQNMSLEAEKTTEDTQRKDNALVETAELLNAVGKLTHDSYINTVKQATRLVRFLHKQNKTTQKEGDSQQ